MTEKARAKAICVVGAQWGDEGKGKVVDYLAAVVRLHGALRGRAQCRAHRHFQ